MTLQALHPSRPHLSLVPSEPYVAAAQLPRCAGCTTPMRPAGTTESQYPGSVPEWGDRQCQSCDYLSAGKDPENRFIDVDRVAYLNEIREEFERGRRSRGVPPTGARPHNTLHLYSV